MDRLRLAWRALTGELGRQLQGLGVTTAREVRSGWVVRTPGQGRGRRWWVQSVRGPAGMHGLVQLRARLVEIHGVRAPERLRAMGADPEHIEEIYLEDAALVVIEYRDWQGEAEGTEPPGAG